MRLIVATLVLALGACGSENQPEEQGTSTAPAATVEIPKPAAAISNQSAPLMAIPDDPEALKRLEAMGYTIHEEQGHLHAPGVTSCPAMGESAAM
jgi:hypothetical protein